MNKFEKKLYQSFRLYASLRKYICEFLAVSVYVKERPVYLFFHSLLCPAGINNSDRILLLIDEAHCTHGGNMGDNLFSAFPYAARIGFTGTLLLTERHEIKNHEHFCGFIDHYYQDILINRF